MERQHQGGHGRIPDGRGHDRYSKCVVHDIGRAITTWRRPVTGGGKAERFTLKNQKRFTGIIIYDCNMSNRFRYHARPEQAKYFTSNELHVHHYKLCKVSFTCNRHTIF